MSRLPGVTSDVWLVVTEITHEILSSSNYWPHGQAREPERMTPAVLSTDLIQSSVFLSLQNFVMELASAVWTGGYLGDTDGVTSSQQTE